MIGKYVPEPSSKLICSLVGLCTGFIFIIIILIVTMTRQGVDQTEHSLETKLKNISMEMHSRVNQLYKDSSQMMEKLTDFEIFMNDFNRSKVTNKLENIGSLVKFLLSDEVVGSLSNNNQRILAAVGKLTDDIRNKNASVNQTLCEPGWTHYALNCYYLSRNARPWDYAKRQCENKKAHLVVINSQDEMNFLRDISQSQSLWIGLSSENEVWKWVDGTSYDIIPKFWRRGEPSSWYRYIKSCTAFEEGKGWSSESCSRSYQYVCEKHD